MGNEFLMARVWKVEVDRMANPRGVVEDARSVRRREYLSDVRVWRSPLGRKNLSRLVLKRNGEVLGLAQLRIIRPTPLKFGMAYLRWGPLWERRGRAPDPEAAVCMAHALEEEYVAKRKLFLRVLPNAFARSARAAVMQSAFSKFTPEPLAADKVYRTFVLDLAPQLGELRKSLDPKWRNKLSGAERNNLKVTAGSGSKEYERFCQIYKNMRERKTFETTVDVEGVWPNPGNPGRIATHADHDL